jgi:hypothetical protein
VFGENPHRLIVPEKVSGDFLGGKYLVVSGGIQIHQEVAVFATESDWCARARPVDDATLAVFRIKVDSDFAGSRPTTPAATNLEVVNSRDIHGHFDVSLFPQRRCVNLYSVRHVADS